MSKSKVDSYISNQPAWQQKNLKLFRELLSAHNEEVSEDIKWNVPVFLVGGKVLFAMSAFKAHTKYNFFNGAILDDQNLFNNGLDSNKSRGIDLKENNTIDEVELSSLIDSAIRKAKGV